MPLEHQQPEPQKAAGRRIKHRQRKSVQLIALNAAIVLAIGGGTAAYGAMSQTITLSVDGERTSIRAFGGTVGDVLDDNGVSLRAGDKVSKALTSGLSDGDVVTVAYAKPLTATVDGKTVKTTVFDRTVDQAVSTLGVADPSDAYVSVKRSAPLPRSGMKLVVSTPKKLTIVADGEKKTVTTKTPTVSGVLAEAGVTVKKDDEVRPAVEEFVTPEATVRVVRITKVTKTETIKLKHQVEVREDPDAMVGEEEVVQPGKNGKARERVTLVYADGKLRKRTVHSTDAVSRPVTEVVSRGTSRTAPDSVWDKIAKCESGGNWSTNTGNGYYGGLQFSAATWKSVGGPGLPHQNSREVQIKYAKILQARSGWGQWGCAHARFD